MPKLLTTSHLSMDSGSDVLDSRLIDFILFFLKHEPFFFNGIKLNRVILEIRIFILNLI